jgi:hypothetical protein
MFVSYPFDLIKRPEPLRFWIGQHHPITFLGFSCLISLSYQPLLVDSANRKLAIFICITPPTKETATFVAEKAYIIGSGRVCSEAILLCPGEFLGVTIVQVNDERTGILATLSALTCVGLKKVV